MAAYVVLLTVLVFTHDVWRDEVRALSVATRTESWAAMFSALGEEGHPALWYAILRAGYWVTNSPLVLPAAAAFAAIASAWVILRYAPFAFFMRLLAIFGVFLGYELSVVARNYGIGVLLLMTACALFDKRWDRPWLLAIVLVLLANTSVHAAIAAALIMALWMAGLREPGERSRVMHAIAATAVVIAGIVFALYTARPSPEMAYAFEWSTLTPGAIAQAILTDPGSGLRGVNGASLVASSEMPWERLGLAGHVASRILVNIAVISIAWGLRKNKLPLVAFVIAVVAFEILFRVIYPGSLRHQGMVAFLMIAICWIAIVTARSGDKEAAIRRISLGILPLLALQTAALPFTVFRGVLKPESMGRSLSKEVSTNPRYASAVLMSEPEAMMETLLYYVDNQVFFPRQREFDYRAYFDKGAKRKADLSLDQLVAIADSVGCLTRQPVLLSIGQRSFKFDDSGVVAGPYGSVFRWSAAEKARFAARARPLKQFPGTTSDENYLTFELAPLSCSVSVRNPQ